MLLRKPFLSLALVLAIVMVSVGAGFALDLKAVQPAKPMQPAAPAKPGLTGIVPALPDLTVLQSSFVVYPPITAGEPVGQRKLRFSVRNVGKAASGRFEVEITCGYTSPVCPGGFNGLSSVPPLAPGAMYEIKWPPLVSSEHTWPAGNFTLIANVDVGNAVKEVGEVPGSGTPALNEHFWDFTVSPATPSAPGGLKIPSGTTGKLAPKPPAAKGDQSITGKKFVTPIEVKGINPQPEPPGLPKVTPTAAAKPGVPAPPSGPGGINPQPEPPRVLRMPEMKAKTAPPSAVRKPGQQPSGGGKLNVMNASSIVPLGDGRIVQLKPDGKTYLAAFTLVDGSKATVPDGKYVTKAGRELTVANGRITNSGIVATGNQGFPDLAVGSVNGAVPVAGEKTAGHFAVTIDNRGQASAPAAIVTVKCISEVIEAQSIGSFSPPDFKIYCKEGPIFQYEISSLARGQSLEVLWPPDLGGVVLPDIEDTWQEGNHDVEILVELVDETLEQFPPGSMNNGKTFSFTPSVQGSIQQ